MQPPGSAFAARGDRLGHAIRFAYRTLKRRGDCVALLGVQALRVRVDGGHLEIASTQAQRLLRQRMNGRRVPGEVGDPIPDERVQVVRNQRGAQVITRHVQLPHGRVPDPERRFELLYRRDELAAEARPAAAVRDVVPHARPGGGERMSRPHRKARAPHSHSYAMTETGKWGPQSEKTLTLIAPIVANSADGRKRPFTLWGPKRTARMRRPNEAGPARHGSDPNPRPRHACSPA